jgi:hypothetical protein
MIQHACFVLTALLLCAAAHLYNTVYCNKQVIDSENLPAVYGGTSQLQLGASPAEVSLRAYVITELAKSGVSMQPVPLV